MGPSATARTEYGAKRYGHYISFNILLVHVLDQTGFLVQALRPDLIMI